MSEDLTSNLSRNMPSSGSFIHGWRTFSFSRCSRTKEIVLRGMAGQHLHSRVQKAAECQGISHALWLTETAKKRLEERTDRKGNPLTHEGPAPDWDCSCGAYFYRTLKDAPQSPTNAQAHVTCLERTMLHQNGGRTTQYSVDYLLAPKDNDLKVFVPVLDGPKAPDPSMPLIYSGYGGFGDWGMWAGEPHKYNEVLAEVADSLGVPILDRTDLKGCPECLIVNSWRKPSEIDDLMRRDWFGEGYAAQERDEAWEDALDD